jgi:2'-5' RNA ligase
VTEHQASPGWQFSAAGLTLPQEDRDYPEWHQGRAHYGVWLIDADVGAVRERIVQAQAHLVPWLVDSPRQPHITLFVCGFIADVAEHGDDFTPAMLAAQQAALQALQLKPFTLHIGAIDSFDSAVFLRVSDPGNGLALLRHALGQGTREIRQSAYVPHLTVGLYQAAFDTGLVAQRLASLQWQAPITLQVERIHFARYQAQVLGGPLEPLLSHALR